MSRNSDLILTTGLALLATLFSLLDIENSWLRILFGLPLALYLPGYAFTAAAFPRLAPGKFERFLLSLGLSLSVTTLGGLLLHWTPWGLTAAAWALLLFAVTLIASLLASRRRRRETDFLTASEEDTARFDLRQLALFGLATLVVALAVWLGRVPASPQGLNGYTLFWLLPSEEMDPQTVRLGVLSQELEQARYRVELRAAGEPVAEWPEVELAPGETWRTTVELPQSVSTTDPLEAILYRPIQPDSPAFLGSETIYRTVKLDRSAPP